MLAATPWTITQRVVAAASSPWMRYAIPSTVRSTQLSAAAGSWNLSPLVSLNPNSFPAPDKPGH